MTKPSSPPTGNTARPRIAQAERGAAPAPAPTPEGEEPEPEVDPKPVLTGAEINGRKCCECPDNTCAGVNALSEDRFCRDNPDAIPEGQGPLPPASDELIKQLASIIVEERAENPDSYFMGKQRWEWEVPTAAAFARMFSLLVNHAMAAGEEGDD